MFRSPLAKLIKDGEVTPYRNAAINKPENAHPGETLMSVQSVVADAANRLWILDTAAPNFTSPVHGGAKLVAIDLATNKIVKTIVINAPALLPTTYLNDVRFDLRNRHRPDGALAEFVAGEIAHECGAEFGIRILCSRKAWLLPELLLARLRFMLPCTL